MCQIFEQRTGQRTEFQVLDARESVTCNGSCRKAGIKPCAIGTAQQAEHPQPPLQIASVLAVMPECEYKDDLETIFQHSSWKLRCVHSIEAAAEHLDAHAFPVVIIVSSVQDGTWRELMPVVTAQPVHSRVLLACRADDQAEWTDALTHGVYDVLVEPFRVAEVFRLVSLAWASWKADWQKWETGEQTRAASASSV